MSLTESQPVTPQASRRPARVEIYDTTLRDGAQGEGVAFSLVDKLHIARWLDALGVDFIEGGYPLSNQKDEAFFEQCRSIAFKHARVCAFGMTRRRDIDPADDPGMQALVNSGAPVITIVGKTWDLHVDQVLRVSREENLAMIRDSVAFCLAQAKPATDQAPEVFYDAEHFFDGYRANPAYAIETLAAAVEGGASRLILCDTNGGSLPGWITQAIESVTEALAGRFPGAALRLGIHTHNDGGLATANALAAVDAGCIQVQGTINGIGERCGNVDLTTVAANLRLKMNVDCLSGDSIQRLTETSRYVYELANFNLNPQQPFVGASAFAHKGGMHVHAVQRAASSYEHIEPEQVGNSRRVLVSELSGASNIAATLGSKYDITDDKAVQRAVLMRVQELEHQGYQFEAASASFELLLHEAMGKRPNFWELDHYRCTILRRDGEPAVTEGVVKLGVAGRIEHTVAEGDGPVNALDGALRLALVKHYPAIASVHLTDYKVRVVNPTAESAAKVRVIIEFRVEREGPDLHFATIGVNENIVDASWQALTDAFAYHLIESHVQPGAPEAVPHPQAEVVGH